MSDVSLAAALAAKPTLRDEQVKAVQHVTQNSGNVQCVSGWAGTGKTFMLDAARLAWERDGYRVYGAALSGKAAKELSKGANIESATIAKWIYDLDRPGRKNRLTLDSKTILVVDEASMVGTRQLHRLMTEVERAERASCWSETTSSSRASMPAADFWVSQNAWATRNSKRSPGSGTKRTGRPCTTWPRATRQQRKELC